MRYSTKIAIVIRDDLATWQRLNVTAYLASAVAAGRPEVIGEPYQDGSGNDYLAMFRQPVLVYQATADALARAHGRALGRELPVAVFTEDLFATNNDWDNRATVRAVPVEKLPLVGIAVYGARNVVDKTLDGLRLHP